MITVVTGLSESYAVIIMLELLSKIFHKGKAVHIDELKVIFEKFKQILAGNNTVLELMAQLEDKLSGEYIFDINYLRQIVNRISDEIYKVIHNLNYISNNNYTELLTRHAEIQNELENIIDAKSKYLENVYSLTYDDLNSNIFEIVGNKNANLSEIRNYLELSTPDGFILTTYAYRHFMEHNELWPEISKIYMDWKNDKNGSAKQYDEAIETLFSKAKLPNTIEEAISNNLRSFYKQHKKKCNIAVRSSAYGEDTEMLSFAGQFKSLLNCPLNDVFSAYIEVIASRFKHNIITYSEGQALDEAMLPMAVGIQQLIPSSTAGVIYTVDPMGNSGDCMMISAVFGLGASVVSGTADADYFKVSRFDPSQIGVHKIGEKTTRMVCDNSQGVKSVPVENGLKAKASLSDEQIKELAETALLLDRYFKRPLDIEWCFDEGGKLYILQCRPLMLRKTEVNIKNLNEILAQKKVLMYKKGQVAQRGIAAGKVYHVKEDDDPLSFPAGCIAVTKHSSPHLSGIIRRARAIITDVGSSTGHMATVAREFGVPLIVNSGNGTQILSDGDEITVDAEENIIYDGLIKELLEYETEAEDVFRDLKEYKLLRYLLRKISPLSMIDPKSASFTAKNCQTYHDILRFCHEKAVQELINMNMSSGRFKGVKAKTLDLSIPLGLFVIDLGGGLSNESNTKEIKSVEKVHSLPMKAILNGLTSPGVWSTQPVQFEFSDLMSSMTRYSIRDGMGEYTGQNLAVISENYMNLSLRLGYHFNVIDTYVSENISDNYVYFRFVGGVTETERRHLRAILLREILEKLNFKVTVNGDLVVANLKKLDAELILGILKEIGRLIGFSRQLDTQMQNQDSVKKYLNKFFN